MEIHEPFSITNLVLLSSFIFILIGTWRKFNSRKCVKRLPPSPLKLPIIGHLHHLVGGLPHHAFRRIAQRYGPVVHLKLGEVFTVLISSPEAAKEVLKLQDLACADRPESIGSKIMWYNCSDIAFSPYNEYWRQMRKICILHLLSAKNVKSFGSIRRDEVLRLIKSILSSSRQKINLTAELFALSSSIICRAAFGEVMMHDRDALIDMVRVAHTMAGGFHLVDMFPSSKLLNALSWNKYKLWRMHQKIDTFLDKIVEQHNLKQGDELGGEDIVDALLRIQRNGQVEVPISNNNIKAVILDMFTGGIETASTTIIWSMVELMRNPSVMVKVQTEVREVFKEKNLEEDGIHELKYLKLVIKETLRLHPPIPLVPRACKDGCIVDGYSILPKSNVMINAWSIGRDPNYWDQPETFKPERFANSLVDFGRDNFEFIPFGAGRRICPAMNFALANVELPLAQLLYHFDWKMPEGMGPDDLDMTEVGGLVVSKKGDLLLVPTVYNASVYKCIA